MLGLFLREISQNLKTDRFWGQKKSSVKKKHWRKFLNLGSFFRVAELILDLERIWKEIAYSISYQVEIILLQNKRRTVIK